MIVEIVSESIDVVETVAETVIVDTQSLEQVEIASNETVVVETPSLEHVETQSDIAVVETNAIEYVEIGIQGPRGVPGATGNGSAMVYSFAWGDATPAEIVVATADKTVFKIEVVIKTPFDVAPSLTVGDSLNHARLFDNTDLDALSVGTYQTNPVYAYGSDTPIVLYLTPGGGTSTGNGIILIYMEA